MRSPKEENIIRVATELFLQRGFDKITVRDISKEAGVNLAMINYYFRSKDNLTAIVIENVITKYYSKLEPVINANQEIKPKIKLYVSTFIDMLAEEPGMVLFLLSVLKSDPKIIHKTPLVKYLFEDSTFLKQLEKEGAEGKIRKVNPEHFYMCMLSLILFPFSIIDMISVKNEYTQKGVTRYVRARKEMISDMVLKYLEPEITV